MIGNDRFGGFAPVNRSMDYAAQELKKYSENLARRQKLRLEGDGAPSDCFASMLRRADEFRASGESCGATDSVGIILRQMEEPKAGETVSRTVFHNGVCVVVEKDYLRGNSITVGGSANPNWIHVDTSVGTVHIDLNDIDSLMKCLDMFSPEDINLILRKITEVRQCKDALQEIDQMRNTPVERSEEQKDEEK
ncbi:MAG: hypothetical protein K2P48_07035 [Lachnospiraceae bacterium]|nr:hypothetical protein [Lachnospiraceae bacterium]